MSMNKSRRYCEICGVRESHLQSPRFFANFPLDESRCREWVRLTGNEDLVHVPIEKLHCNKHICADHFKKTHINKNHTRLKKKAVPSVKLSSTPLSDDQMTGFPLHVFNKRVESEASTSKEDQSESIQKTPTPTQKLDLDVESEASTSKEDQSESIQKTPTPTQKLDLDAPTSPSHQQIQPRGEKRSFPENEDKILSTAAPTSPRHQQVQPRGEKRSFPENEELTPRKKKLVERLKKTECTLKSLKKSAVIIDKIQSPVLKELIVNSCKNERKKSKGRRWSTKHKLSCLAILKRSPKTYRYLCEMVTLPSTKTLQNILKKVPMKPGLSESVLSHLKLIAESKDINDRTCNLAFDEMALKSRLIYNEADDIVEGYVDLGELGRSDALADHALVFMLQGIRKKFKQPLAFYLTKGTISSANLAGIIKSLIMQVTACGFTVLNTVCDQGPTNMGALKLLREASGPYEDASNHYFKVQDKIVYIMYDVPHLFKSVRNNFLKASSMHMGGVKGQWAHLIEVERLNRNFLYLSKITESHINPKYKGKMRVKLAAQALSNTVAAVLKLLARAEQNKRAEELLGTADIVSKLDRLFDVTNGPSGPIDVKRDIRCNVSEKSAHMEKWVDYIKLLNDTKFVAKNGMPLRNVKCIQGYITSLKSLRDIWRTVKNLGFKFLNLRNLNQDALENLFGVIRQHSPTNRNPTATHFMAALKTAVVTGLTAPHSRGANCEQDKKKLLTDFHSLIFGDETSTSNEKLTEQDTDAQTSPEAAVAEIKDNVSVIAIPEEDESMVDFSLLSEQPTVYVAGYLAKQLLKKVDCQTCKQLFVVKDPGDNPMYAFIFLREWWQTKFSLTYPSANFCHTVKSMVAVVETKIVPQMHKPNICLLGCSLFELADPDPCFSCEIHGNTLKTACYKITAKLLVRRQCQIINANLAAKEEDLANMSKKAEQQGKAK